MRHRIVSAMAALIATSTLPAAAQDLMMGGINQSWTSTQLLLNSEKKAWAAPECVDERKWSTDCKAPRPQPNRRAPLALKPDGAARARPSGPVDAAALSFRPSPERRKQNLARFVAKTRATDPRGAAELEKFVADDLIGVVGTRIAPFGLRTDDVADAMALYVMEAWEFINDRQTPTTRARAMAVRGQIARSILAMPAIAEASDAAKQETADALLVQAAMVANGAAIVQRDGDRKQIEAWRAAVYQGSKATLGFDLKTIVITEEGMMPKKALGAVPAAKAAGE
jgi:hypothetical protein